MQRMCRTAGPSGKAGTHLTDSSEERQMVRQFGAISIDR